MTTPELTRASADGGIEDWQPRDDTKPLFGHDRTPNPDFFRRTMPKRTTREKLADAWRGLRDGWRGAL